VTFATLLDGLPFHAFILQIVHLKKNRALLSPYVAIGTAEVKGEDNEAKGAVYLFEVAHLEVRKNNFCDREVNMSCFSLMFLAA
jgi:hypothetical protein